MVSNHDRHDPAHDLPGANQRAAVRASRLEDTCWLFTLIEPIAGFCLLSVVCILYFDNYVFEALHVFGLGQGLVEKTQNRNQLLDTRGA